MNEKQKQLLEKYEGKLKDLKAIADKDIPTQEDMMNAATLKADLSSLRGELETIKSVGNLREELKSLDSFLNSPAMAYRPAGAAQATTGAEGTKYEQMGTAGLLSEKQMRTIRDSNYLKAFDQYLRKDIRDMDSFERKALQEGIDDQGGFLVPFEFMARLIEKKPTPTRVSGLVERIPTSRDSVVLPRVNYTTDNLYTTGIRVTYTGEIPASATTHRVTEPVFGQINIQVYTAMLSMPLTNNMVEDAAFDVQGWASGKFSETIDLLDDNMILNGTGVNQPAGILQNPNATNEPATVVSGSASTLTADGLFDLTYAVPEQYDENCRFVFNKTSTMKTIAKLKDQDNRYLFQSGNYADTGIATARPKELLGYPFALSGFMPDCGSNTYPVIFGDLSGYLLVQRLGFSVQVLRELYAETNQLLLLGRYRHGGDVAEPWKLQIQKCST